MNLIFNQPNKINFSVTIAGTQTRPSDVRLLLGDSTKLSFQASSDDGINYTAIVTPIRDIVSSICQLTIEVQFGEKVFTPIRRQVTVNDEIVPINISVNDPVTLPSTMQSASTIDVPNTSFENEPIEIVAVDPSIPSESQKDEYRARYESLMTEILSGANNLETNTTISVGPIEVPAAPQLKQLKSTVNPIRLTSTFETKSHRGVDTDPSRVAKSILAEAESPTKKTAQTYIPRKPKVVNEDNEKAAFQIVKEDVFYK